MQHVNHISLCAGVGGIDLGLKHVIPSIRTVAMVEREAFCLANLAYQIKEGRLDNALLYTDLTRFPWERYRNILDLVSGGFPCQPFSHAGKQQGVEDERHLWPYVGTASSKTSMESQVPLHLGITQFSTMSSSTWKNWVSLQRQDASQRRKLGHLIFEKDGSSLECETQKVGGCQESSSTNTPVGSQTSSCVSHNNWPTPDVTLRPHEGNVRLLRKGVMSGMLKSEADAMLGRDISKAQGKLPAWPTASSRDWKDTPGMSTSRGDRTGEARKADQLPRAVFNLGLLDLEKIKETGNLRASLSPTWVETLMGFPIGWTDSKPWATR